MSINFAAQLAKMITAGLGGAMEAPETNVSVGYWFTEKTASGNPVSFSDGAGGKPVKSLEIAFSPKQDLNGYDHPWPGGGGKNKFDIEGCLDSAGATYTKDGDSYTITAISALFSTPFVFADEDTTVTLSVEAFTNGTTSNVRIDFLNSSETVVGTLYAGPFTSKTVTASKMRFNWSTAGTFTISKPQLELGSTVSAYEPYSNICPISGWSQLELHHADDTEEIQLGATYYGGSVDVVSGDGTADKVAVDMGSLTWTAWAGDSNGSTFVALVTNKLKASTYALSTVYETVEPTSSLWAEILNYDKAVLAANGDTYILARDTDYTDAASFKSAVTGQILVYELATPIPITVTPKDIVTQEGGNIFITDANGNMTITYTAVGYTEGY